jgi:hypothetical protein
MSPERLHEPLPQQSVLFEDKDPDWGLGYAACVHNVPIYKLFIGHPWHLPSGFLLRSHTHLRRASMKLQTSRTLIETSKIVANRHCMSVLFIGGNAPLSKLLELISKPCATWA